MIITKAEDNGDSDRRQTVEKKMNTTIEMEEKKSGRQEKKQCYCCGKIGHTKNVCYNRQRACTHCHRNGHTKSTCWRRTATCYCCGKRGHIKSECKYRKSKCSACGKMGHTERTCRRRQRQAKNGLNPKAKAYRANRRSSPKSRSTESEVSKTFLKSHMMVESDQITPKIFSKHEHGRKESESATIPLRTYVLPRRRLQRHNILRRRKNRRFPNERNLRYQPNNRYLKSSLSHFQMTAQ